MPHNQYQKRRALNPWALYIRPEVRRLFNESPYRKHGVNEGMEILMLEVLANKQGQ